MKNKRRECKKAAAMLLAALMVVNSVDLSAFTAYAAQSENVPEIIEQAESSKEAVMITGFDELEEDVMKQQLPVGASEEEIVFPDTLNVTVSVSDIQEETDTTDNEGSVSGNTDTVSGNAVSESEESDVTGSKSDESAAEEQGTQDGEETKSAQTKKITLTDITWKIDAAESDGEAFDSCKDCDGYCYVYTPVIPKQDADGNVVVLGEDVETPVIYVLIGESDHISTIEERYEASVTIDGETQNYATLEEAFSAADGKTATITMLNDAECTVTDGSPINVMNKSNITLNMNGKTLSGHGTGSCGIITLATGSLSVQGPGTMKSTYMCLSCQSKNAKMTVENITFDVSEAEYGVWVVSSNTVTLNNIQIIGKAETSAVYQYSDSANVTINNMNAIEAGYSDVVYKGGTLKINGGTFDKISVTSNNT